MSVGTLIRQRRIELGLTQDQVSTVAGICKPYLSNIETGRAKNPPTDPVLAALEKALRFQPGELIQLANIERTPPSVRQQKEALEEEIGRLRDAIGGLVKNTPQGEMPPQVDEFIRQVSTDMQSAPVLQNVRTLTAGAKVPIINRVAAGYPQSFTDLEYPPGVADDYLRVPDLHDAQAFATRVVGDSMEPDYREGDIVVFSPNTPARNGDDCFVRFDGDFSTTFKRFYQDGEQSVRLQPLNSRYPAQTYDPQRITGVWPAVFRFERLRR